MSLQYKDTLFHGTISEIENVDVTKGKSYKDFGLGFYMAVEKSQAIGMMHKKYREAVRRSRNKSEKEFSEHLYEVKIDTEYLKNLKVKVFYSADMEWLEFILKCREEGGKPHDYDVIIGPTADDDTLLCLRSYWDGLYGSTGSRDAKEILLRNLEPDNLGTQYYIGNQEAVQKLIVGFTEVKRG